ncbi:MAG: zinc ribbon domain-containing protein [Candidatus Heimdallarchaeaceae archaeon]
MITNTSDKTRQVSTLLKIAAGLFVLSAIMDSVNYFNYASYALSLIAFISNIISIIFLAVVLFSMKALADTGTSVGSSKFNQASGGLIAYAILWSIYNFTPSLGVFGDLGFFIVVLTARGIAFYLVNGAFKFLRKGMENRIYPIYGFNQLAFFVLIFVSVYIGGSVIGSIFSTISYWADTLLMIGVAIFLFLGSNKVTAAPRAIPSTAQPYAPGTIYTPYQPPVQPPTQPIQYKAPPTEPSSCSNCGADLEIGAKFCTNCGANVG